MSSKKFLSISAEDAAEQITDTVLNAGLGKAPFALVLGSGFSHGLVPTASELVEISLPLWMKSGRAENSFRDLKAEFPEGDAEIAKEFWENFCRNNRERDLVLPLSASTGLPESHSDAYRAAFDPRFKGAVGGPADARQFQRILMQLERPRLNAAHFLLASLLGVQSRRTAKSEAFHAGAAFSRLILTTNFDPFLQIALQAANRLYFMSDTPDLGVTDEVLDDQTDAIHLVCVHGSIHRRFQAATTDSIEALKQKNARILTQALKRHGVIVLGYSGWDDAIVEALADCDEFANRLYWCGREADPLREGAFGPRVSEILQKQSAFYVQIKGAGDFMAKVFGGLVVGRPRCLKIQLRR